MAGRGVLFAITEETTSALLAASSDEAVMEIVERIEEEWNEAYVAETDKAWDAMHRTLSDGSLDNEAGEYPLNRTIFGGKHLHEGDDYIVALVPKDEVPDVARALASIDEKTFRDRYHRLVPKAYALEYGDDDLDYTWENFGDVAELYARAARDGCAVIFTVDQ